MQTLWETYTEAALVCPHHAECRCRLSACTYSCAVQSFSTRMRSHVHPACRCRGRHLLIKAQLCSHACSHAHRHGWIYCTCHSGEQCGCVNTHQLRIHFWHCHRRYCGGECFRPQQRQQALQHRGMSFPLSLSPALCVATTAHWPCMHTPRGTQLIGCPETGLAPPACKHVCMHQAQRQRCPPTE